MQIISFDSSSHIVSMPEILLLIEKYIFTVTQHLNIVYYKLIDSESAFYFSDGHDALQFLPKWRSDLMFKVH